MRVLVTGGAGYIGSVIVARLTARGHDVIVYDDLSRGHAASVPDDVPLVRGDVRDAAAVRAALVDGGCEAVVHMAALAEVAESVAEPDRYFSVNVDGTAAVVEAAAAAGAGRLVFSSTAAVYGAPERTPIDEGDTLAPANPYGETKLAGERLLQQARVARRASPPPPCATSTPAAPTAPAARITTPSRTSSRWRCAPLATVRRSACSATTTPRRTAPACATTCTSPTSPTRTSPRSRRCRASRARSTWGRGRVTRCRPCSTPSRPSPVWRLRRETASRRAGDPPVLVAGNERAAAELGWRPRRSLTDAVADAWAWMLEHPDGYAER